MAEEVITKNKHGTQNTKACYYFVGQIRYEKNHIKIVRLAVGQGG